MLRIMYEEKMVAMFNVSKSHWMLMKFCTSKILYVFYTLIDQLIYMKWLRILYGKTAAI